MKTLGEIKISEIIGAIYKKPGFKNYPEFVKSIAVMCMDLRKQVKEIENFQVAIENFIREFLKDGRIFEQKIYEAGYLVTPYIYDKYVGKLKLSQFENKNFLTEYYREIFRKNNYLLIKELFCKWDGNKYFCKREKILAESLTLLRNKHNEDINIFLFIVPVLIMQIDGICFDYLKDAGFKFEGTRILDPGGKAYYKWKWVDTYRDKRISVDYFKLMIRDILFKSSY